MIQAMELKVSSTVTYCKTTLAALCAALMVAGCGTPKEKPKPEPKIVTATFEGQTVDQVRTALMVACSNEKWTIRSKTGEVSCENTKLASRRYDEIERMVNDPMGQRYSENIQFDISADGATITAKGHAWIQYVVPGGLYTSATVKTLNLDDDQATEQVRKLLTNAKDKLPKD